MSEFNIPQQSRRMSTEMLAVIIIGVLVLAGVVVPLLSNAMKFRKTAQARLDVNSLETVINLYLTQYQKLPVPAADQGVADKTYDSNTVFELLNTLRAIDLGVGWNKGHALNPQRTVFLDLIKRAGSVDRQGRLLDPWGGIYSIALDTNFDGHVLYSNQTYTISRKTSAVVVSFGPNGKPDDPVKGQSDDIISGM